MIVHQPRLTVATVLEPSDRARVDAAAGGRVTTIHAESVPDAIRAVRERPVQAVLLSPTHVPREHVPSVAALVRAFPGVQAVAVVSRHDPSAAERLLALGASGIHTLLDLTRREGWGELRETLCHPTSPATAAILGQVMPDLADASPDCRLWFETMIRLAPGTPTVRRLCERLGVHPSSFVSRFFRAALPSPKRYLAAVRLLYVAALLESRGLSVADAAYRLEYSSPQSFGRHLRTVTGLTASEFRRSMPLPRALADFRARLLHPYRAVLRAFHPLEPQGSVAPGRGAQGRSIGGAAVRR